MLRGQVRIEQSLNLQPQLLTETAASTLTLLQVIYELNSPALLDLLLLLVRGEKSLALNLLLLWVMVPLEIDAVNNRQG
jgi:hypothetical protein